MNLLFMGVSSYGRSGFLTAPCSPKNEQSFLSKGFNSAKCPKAYLMLIWIYRADEALLQENDMVNARNFTYPIFTCPWQGV